MGQYVQSRIFLQYPDREGALELYEKAIEYGDEETKFEAKLRIENLKKGS